MMLQRITWARLPVCGPMTVFWGMPNGNETLLHSWSSLEGSIRMSIMFAGMDRALRNMDVKRHSDIVDAIESGDAERPPRPCGIIWPAQLPFSCTEPPDPGASLRKKSSPLSRPD